jgi:negative regulator of flagellin synthesis FlgM
MKGDTSIGRKSIFDTGKTQVPRTQSTPVLERNDFQRKKELEEITKQDASVDIKDAIKDFSRIKKAVDNAPETDNANRIAELKAKISEGSYSVDFDALADKLLQSQF